MAVAAFTKSAQVPFQKWLLGAMVAPTPVSALLHSATMVNLGVYFLLRLSPHLVGQDVIVWAIGIVGAILVPGDLIAWPSPRAIPSGCWHIRPSATSDLSSSVSV